MRKIKSAKVGRGQKEEGKAHPNTPEHAVIKAEGRDHFAASIARSHRFSCLI